jgi:aminocarboxymuconate-semialdehyde decarboxylase
MIIDFSSHLITTAVAKELQTKPYYGIDEKKEFRLPMQNADLAQRLKLMEKYGIDKQVLSLTSASLMGLTVEEAVRVCRLANDGISEFCKKRPDRFVGLAAVTLLDVEEACDELDRAIETLGFRGVIIATNQNGNGLDSADYDPFYQRVVKYKIPILLHPTHWRSYPLVDDKMMTIFGWPFDTTQAVWRMITGGVLDKFPGLKVVMHHLGAMFPYFGGRVNSYIGQSPRGGKKTIREYYDQIYGDTAIDAMPGAFMCGYAFFGPDRMLFGTDYPFGLEEGELFIRDNLENVRAMTVPEEVKEKILSKNAERLLKI